MVTLCEFRVERAVSQTAQNVNRFSNFILKSREKIIDLLKTHPEYSARKLAETIGISDKAVEKHLAKLKAEGLIQRQGPDKGGKWSVL